MKKEEKSKYIKLFYWGLFTGTMLANYSENNIYIPFILFFLITIGWGIYYYREEN